jgi:hypothetical protein
MVAKPSQEDERACSRTPHVLVSVAGRRGLAYVLECRDLKTAYTGSSAGIHQAPRVLATAGKMRPDALPSRTRYLLARCRSSTHGHESKSFVLATERVATIDTQQRPGDTAPPSSAYV